MSEDIVAAIVSKYGQRRGEKTRQKMACEEDGKSTPSPSIECKDKSFSTNCEEDTAEQEEEPACEQSVFTEDATGPDQQTFGHSKGGR